MITFSQLYEMRIEQRKTFRDIAERFKCSQTHVFNQCRKFNIPEVPLHICEPSAFQIAVVTGSLLGDGNLSKPRYDGCNSNFREMHSVSQRAYCLWKYEVLRNLCNKPPKPRENDGAWCFNTFTHPWFTVLRQLWYPNDIKHIPRNIELDDVSIGVWFLDDGWLRKDKRQIEIYTNAFEIEEVDLLVARLKRRQIDAVRAKRKKYPIIRIHGKENIRRIVEIAAKLNVPGMEYKCSL